MTNQRDNRYVTVRRGAIGLGVAAALFGAGAAQADVTLFGEARLSINGDNNAPIDLGQQNTYMASNQSKFGFKGSEDLGNGLKAIFNFAWEINPTITQYPGQTNTLVDQDQWVGLAGNFGRLVFGTLSTGYKASGKAIDPLYETSLQAREFPGIQSELQRGATKFGGRETQAINYESPDFMGLRLVGYGGLDQTTASGPAYGAGLHYSNGPLLGFFDYINGNLPQAENPIGIPQGVKGNAYKIGGKFDYAQFSLFGQYEWDAGLITQARFADKFEARFPGLGSQNVPVVSGNGGNTWEVGGSAKFGNTLLVLEYGQVADSTGRIVATGEPFTLNSTKGWVFGVRQWLSKRTDLYAGYTAYNLNQTQDSIPFGKDESRWTMGIDHTF
jgi:predicted porin